MHRDKLACPKPCQIPRRPKVEQVPEHPRSGGGLLTPPLQAYALVATVVAALARVPFTATVSI
eukprot:4272808-Amphidinium_carterae.1